jgi:hypothetical protein
MFNAIGRSVRSSRRAAVYGLVGATLTGAAGIGVSIAGADGNTNVINLPSLTNVTYGDSDIALPLDSSAGVSYPIAYSVGSSTACSIATDNLGNPYLHILAAGPCDLTADQPGDGLVPAATEVVADIDIAKAQLTVVPDTAQMSYGAAVPSLTGAVASNDAGLVNGDTVNTLAGLTGSPQCSTTATSSSDVGNYPVTCTAGTLSSTDYSFVGSTVQDALTIVKADIDLSDLKFSSVSLSHSPRGAVQVSADVTSAVTGQALPDGQSVWFVATLAPWQTPNWTSLGSALTHDGTATLPLSGAQAAQLHGIRDLNVVCWPSDPTNFNLGAASLHKGILHLK